MRFIEQFFLFLTINSTTNFDKDNEKWEEEHDEGEEGKVDDDCAPTPNTVIIDEYDTT